MPAAINLPVIGHDDQRVFLEIERAGDLLEHRVGASGGGIPARIARAAFVMAGIIHLVKVNQDQLMHGRW